MVQEIQDKKVVYLKLFKNAHDNNPYIVYLFHDVYYDGDEVKNMMKKLFTSQKEENVDKLIIYDNAPAFFIKDIEEKEMLVNLKRLIKQCLYQYSSIYDIAIELKEV